MAQADYIISNQTFPNTRADINNHLSAIATNNSGTSAPTTQYAGQFWIDTTTTNWTLYIHDGTDDIQFATIDTSANTVNFTDSALDVVTDTTPQLGGDLDLNSNDITGTGNINITGTATVSGDLTVDTNTLFVDASENKIAIGTTDVGTDADTKLNIFHADSPTLLFERSSGNSNGAIRVGSGGLISFLNGADTRSVDALSERMRIDSSGNVLVGKTSTDQTVAGTTLFANGKLAPTVDSDTVIYANRETNDGDIIEFRKDGTTAGSIGSAGSGGDLYISSSAGAGIYFGGGSGSGSVAPTTDGSTRVDNVVDLGNSSYRWNDLFLGGSVYLGGTGSANALDDYEEGTWTPTYSSETGSFGSITYDGSVQGFYTKIGRMVHLMGFIRTDDVSVGTASSYLYLDGLPFTILNGYTAVGINTKGGTSDWGGNYPLTLEGVPNASKAFIGYRSTANANQTLIQVSDMVTGVNSNKNTLYFSITYQST